MENRRQRECQEGKLRLKLSYKMSQILSQILHPCKKYCKVRVKSVEDSIFKLFRRQKRHVQNFGISDPASNQGEIPKPLFDAGSEIEKL